jgi:hypothetical protein
MAGQRRLDLVLDSVKRLLRIGATANLVNLLQKRHPTDLAQVFGELSWVVLLESLLTPWRLLGRRVFLRVERGAHL